MKNGLIDIIITYLPLLLSYKNLMIFLLSSSYLYSIGKMITMSYIYFTPKNKTELLTAIELYYNNRSKGLIKYGDIGRWNTINIVDMSFLFENRIYFNESINDWIVHQVKNMSQK